MLKENLTPQEIVNQLDEFVIGQKSAKRAVAVALRNRYRRLQLSADMQEDIQEPTNDWTNRGRQN